MIRRIINTAEYGHMRCGRLLATAVLGSALMGATDAGAVFTVTIEQVGANVVTTGSGSLDLTDLTFVMNNSTEAGLFSTLGAVVLGVPPDTSTDSYSLPNPLPFFGTGGVFFPDNGSGDQVGIQAGGNNLFVPHGYVSGNPLADTDAYDNQTLDSMGLTLGTYTATWGTGVHADSFVLDIVAAPEPASVALLGAGLFGLGAIRRRKH